MYDAPKAVPRQSGIDRPQGMLVRIGADWKSVDTIASFPGNELYVDKEVGGFVELPMGRAGLAAANQRLAVLAQSDSNWISIYDTPSRQVRRVSVDLQGRPATRAEFLAIAKTRVAEQARRETRELLSRVFATAPIPTGRRYLRSLAIDGEDRIWIETLEVSPGNRSTWVVMDKNGRQLARVALPANSKVLGGNERQLLLSVRPEGEPEAVRLYRILR